MSVPSPVAATSAGLATGSLEKENGKREAAWRPILLIAAVVAIGLGIVGTRAISGRKADGDAPPGLSLNATSATIATIAPPPASATQPAVPGDPSPPPAERVSAPPPAVSTSPKPHRPSPSPSGSAALRAPTLPGPAGSIGRPPSPAASAASLTRQSGSDDDIR